MTDWMDWDPPEVDTPYEVSEDDAYEEMRQERVDRGEWDQDRAQVSSSWLERYKRDALAGKPPELILEDMTQEELASLPH